MFRATGNRYAGYLCYLLANADRTNLGVFYETTIWNVLGRYCRMILAVSERLPANADVELDEVIIPCEWMILRSK